MSTSSMMSAESATARVMRPSAFTSANSRTRRNRRLTMRGVPRERRAISIAPSALISAFSKPEDRAKDAYLYVLNNCKKPEERYATIQKALPLLSRQNLDLLLATEQKTPDGKGEFAALRGDIARQSLANADADPKLVIPATSERV